MSNQKYYYFMFCYSWRNDHKQGDVSISFGKENKNITNGYLGFVMDEAKDLIYNRLGHPRHSLNLVCTNIIFLGKMTEEEFNSN